MNRAVLLSLVALVALVALTACDGGISLDYKDYIPHPEICVNGVDDDGNGLIDCDDPACFSNPVCAHPKGHGLVAGEGEGEGGEGEGAFGGEGEGEGPACGDDVIEGTEVCDGSDLAGQDCFSQGFENGFLQCKTDCSGFDLTNCNGVCGDGVVTGSESCDGADLGGETCADFTSPFGGTGTLSCDGSCHFDPSACVAPFCGDGVRNGAEDCEGTDLGGETCADFTSPSGGTGTLACDGSCNFDSSACVPPFCGDGVRNGDEDCEGTDLGGADCVTVGLGLGTLACAADCTFDETNCAPPVCGDGVISNNESCDGSDLRGETCLNFTGGLGTLSCDPNSCQLDASQCQPPVCGDGLINQFNETCDTTNLGGETCQFLGFQAGTLGCLTDCSGFDTSQCVPFICGNGTREGNETCDRGDLGGQSCASQGFVTGTLACAGDCHSFDTSACNGCGNGIINPGEQCDDGNNVDGDFCSSTCTLEVAATAESEPNSNEPVQAPGSDFNVSAATQSFSADAIVSASLNPAGDEDEFLITNNTAADVLVHLQTFVPSIGECRSTNGETTDTVLQAFSLQGQSLAISDDDGQEGNGNCSSFDVTVPANSSIIADVVVFNDQRVISAYQLLIDFR